MSGLDAIVTKSEGRKALVSVPAVARALAEAMAPAEVVDIERKLHAAEQYMREAGMFRPEEVQAVNELRMRARWKLGQLLAGLEREAGPGRGKKMSRPETSFRSLLRDLNLDKQRAVEAQRIATLPEPELEKAFAEAREHGVLSTFAGLIRFARPWWYKASREKKHEQIAERAAAQSTDGKLGPFPLIYADPPWKFEIYSAKGLERTPGQHYPTLSDDEIAHFKVGGRTIREIAHKDAALLMWCTSSNLERALGIMEAWGFTYKASAVWVKTKADGKPWQGLGLVFRNAHELLLYGTRGNMPGPQYQPSSVFMHKRGRHSAKPPEIRKQIEKMYPDFDADTRIELFAREQIKGWTVDGFESS